MDEETAKRVKKMQEYADVGKICVTIGDRTYYINEVEYRKLEEFRKRKK